MTTQFRPKWPAIVASIFTALCLSGILLASLYIATEPTPTRTFVVPEVMVTPSDDAPCRYAAQTYVAALETLASDLLDSRARGLPNQPDTALEASAEAARHAYEIECAP